jgi:hypothetical protein
LTAVIVAMAVDVIKSCARLCDAKKKKTKNKRREKKGQQPKGNEKRDK